MNSNKVAQCVLSDVVALFLVLTISILGGILFHVPPGITFIQILTVELLAQTLLISTLAHDKNTHKLSHKTERQAIIELAIFSTLAATLAYANYLFFFVRQDLSPTYIDPANPLHVQATTLTYLTILLCQLANLLFVRADEHKSFFTQFLFSNRKLLQALGTAFLLVINIIYNPWLQPIFTTKPLGVLDWLTAIGCVALYTGLRILQRHTRQHTRHAVLKLHRETSSTHEMLH